MLGSDNCCIRFELRPFKFLFGKLNSFVGDKENYLNFKSVLVSAHGRSGILVTIQVNGEN